MPDEEIQGTVPGFSPFGEGSGLSGEPALQLNMELFGHGFSRRNAGRAIFYEFRKEKFTPDFPEQNRKRIYPHKYWTFRIVHFFKLLCGLLNDKSFDYVVNAADCAREGN